MVHAALCFPLCRSPRSVSFVSAYAGVRPIVQPRAGATCMAVSPDGGKALTGGGPQDAALRLWDLERGSVQAIGALTRSIQCVALSPDMRYALTGGIDKSIRVWDLTKGRALRLLTGHTGAVTSVAVSPDGHHALS